MEPSSDGLFFDRVIKSFGGTQALKGVSLKVGRGEIVALLGENGAGKSTLIKVLGGIHSADRGEVFIDGIPYAHEAGRAGGQKVAFIHQDLGLIEWMSVAENIALALGYAKKGRRIDWTATEAMADRALKLVDADFPATARVNSLTRTQKSLVAIARTLAADCDYLVLDEPTASLPADEVERLFSALRSLKTRGVGMIYVSHRLDEIFRIADRVAVLRDGKLVGVTSVKSTTPAALVHMIVGREVKELYHRGAKRAGKETLSVVNLRTHDAGPVSFKAREGEVLGLVGLRGAGQESIGRALFGAAGHVGQVELDGRKLDLSSTTAALNQGIGLMARDRTEESVALSLSVRENMFLNPWSIGRTLMSVLSPSTEAEQAQTIGASVGLRPNDAHLPVEALSGGNQQKVVVGRWLETRRRVLIAEDPTSGVDVGAKAEIYRLIAKALESQLTVIVVSTDFEEVANICHRALVFSRGKITAEISDKKLTTQSLIHAASAAEAA